MADRSPILPALLLPLLMSLSACGHDTSAGPPASADAVTAPAGNQQLDLALAAHRSVDTRCRTDDDCAVKNVGNCCGEYLACVNIDSPTDPDAVARECARSGTVGICGFPEISACACVDGQCHIAGTGPNGQERLQ